MHVCISIKNNYLLYAFCMDIQYHNIWVLFIIVIILLSCRHQVFKLYSDLIVFTIALFEAPVPISRFTLSFTSALIFFRWVQRWSVFNLKWFSWYGVHFIFVECRERYQFLSTDEQKMDILNEHCSSVDVGLILETR